MASIDITNAALLLGAALAVLGILSSLVAQRFGAPLLLIFLVIGMLAGEDGPGGLSFSDYKLTYLIGSLALAVILFDGGLRTKLGHLRGAVMPAVTLATVGVIVTAALTGAVATYLFHLPPLEGLLVGAVVSSTDAAAVFFLIHAGGLQLRRRVGATLEMESATNDPVAVFLTMVVVQVVVAANAGVETHGLEIAKFLALQISIGAIGGVIGGFAASWLLNRIDLPGGLHPLMVIALAVLIYGLTAVLEGSGFLAVYLAGMIMGNRPLRAQASIVTVNDAATWLSQIVMFMVLGLLVTPSKLLTTALPATAVAAFLLLFGRPIAVWLCLTPFGFSAKEKWLVSWVGLRGAVSIFLAAIPTLSGVPHADLYFNIAFVVVLLSLLIQGWTLTWSARKLGLALPRTASAVHRQEVDLPGQLALEMVGYRVRAESAVMNGAAIPVWARPAFVVRAEVIVTPSQAGALQRGDYAYFLAPPARAAQLDQLFAPHAELLSTNEPFFGEFTFDGAIKLKDMETFYGLSVTDHDPNLTVDGLFNLQFEGKPEVGDHLPLGGAVLVVREVEDDRVVRAGLQLDAHANEAPAAVGPLAKVAEKIKRRITRS
jgi:cell volume regulation protein A